MEFLSRILRQKNLDKNNSDILFEEFIPTKI